MQRNDLVRKQAFRIQTQHGTEQRIFLGMGDLELAKPSQMCRCQVQPEYLLHSLLSKCLDQACIGLFLIPCQAVDVPIPQQARILRRTIEIVTVPVRLSFQWKLIPPVQQLGQGKFCIRCMAVWLYLIGWDSHQLTAQHHRPLLVCFPQAAMMLRAERQQMDLMFRVPVGFPVLFPVLLRAKRTKPKRMLMQLLSDGQQGWRNVLSLTEPIQQVLFPLIGQKQQPEPKQGMVQCQLP